MRQVLELSLKHEEEEAEWLVAEWQSEAERALGADMPVEFMVDQSHNLKPKVEAMTNVRHRNMLRVVLGEVLESQRFFEQALAGRTDLLGKRTPGVGKLEGEVLQTRWIE